MSWNIKKYIYKDFMQDILENPNDYPLYGFLKHLYQNQVTLSLKLMVTKRLKENKIQEIILKFNEETEFVVSLFHLKLMNYQDWLENPILLIETLEEDTQVQRAYYLYNQSKEKLKFYASEYQALEKQENRSHATGMKSVDAGRLISSPYLTEYKRKVEVEALAMKDYIHGGALVGKRLRDSYRNYLSESKQPALPEASSSEDFIEVQLVTILGDPDISEATKLDAQETLDEYLEMKTETEALLNPKEDDARLSIQTIRAHYLKKTGERGN